MHCCFVIAPEKQLFPGRIAVHTFYRNEPAQCVLRNIQEVQCACGIIGALSCLILATHKKQDRLNFGTEASPDVVAKWKARQGGPG